MNFFGKRRKKQLVPNRFKITYQSKAGTVHYSMVLAQDAERARKQFLNYYSSPGDEITDISLEPKEEGVGD